MLTTCKTCRFLKRDASLPENLGHCTQDIAPEKTLVDVNKLSECDRHESILDKVREDTPDKVETD